MVNSNLDTLIIVEIANKISFTPDIFLSYTEM